MKLAPQPDRVLHISNSCRRDHARRSRSLATVSKLWMSASRNLMNLSAGACFLAARCALGRLLCLGHDGTLCVLTWRICCYTGVSPLTIVGHSRWAQVRWLGCKGRGVRCRRFKEEGLRFISLTPFKTPAFREIVVCITLHVLKPACRPSVIGVTPGYADDCSSYSRS
jgi:hypothetical protein